MDYTYSFEPLEIALNQLNIPEFDRKLYLAALGIQHPSISSLARHLKVERPTVYAGLERLRAAGLAPASNPPFSRQVQVEPPSRVLALLEARQANLQNNRQALEQALPELMAGFAAKGNVSTFRLHEGRTQFLAVFEEAVREAKSEMLFYGNANRFVEYVGPDYEKQWIKKRLHRQLKMRILVSHGPITEHFRQVDTKELRETRFLPTGTQIDSSYMLYGAKTLIWNPLAERAIVIDDPVVAALFCQMFETSWQAAKDK